MKGEVRRRSQPRLRSQWRKEWEHMAMMPIFLNIDETRMVAALREAGGRLDRSEGETVLDFSSVHRVDSKALNAMEQLAGIADDKNVKVVLRGVNPDVYKVLKLVKLTRRCVLVN